MKAVGDALWFDRQKKGALAQLGRSEDNVRRKIQELNPALSDAAATYAAKKLLDDERRFEPPKDGMATTAAKAWVHRGKIALGVAALAGMAALAGGAVVAKNKAEEAALNRAETRVEEKVESAYVDFTARGVELDNLLKSSDVATLPSAQSSRFKLSISNAQEQLTPFDAFFEEYTTNGVADDRVTRGNFRSVDSGLARAREAIDRASAGLADAEGVLEEKARIGDLRVQLVSTYGTVKDSNIPAVFKRQAATAYAAGVGYVDSWDYSSGVAELRTLQSVRQDANSFSQLTDRVGPLCSTVQSTAKERDVQATARELCSNAQEYARSASVDPLKNTIRDLERYEALVTKDLEIRRTRQYVARFGRERTVLERIDEDTGANALYMFVAAYDKSTGRQVPYFIENIECKLKPDWCVEEVIPLLTEVKAWGEEISLKTSERIEDQVRFKGNRDYALVFGDKPRGYTRIDVRPEYPEGRKSQVTTW